MCGVATHAEVEYAGYGLLHVGFEVPSNSQVGCVAQPRTRSVGYAGYGLLQTSIKSFVVINLRSISLSVIS